MILDNPDLDYNAGLPFYFWVFDGEILCAVFAI